MKKLFENWNKYLDESVNESIGMKNYEMLYQTLTAAYKDGMRSYRSDQKVNMGNDKYRPVDSDMHVEVRRSLVDLIMGRENSDGTREPGMLDEIEGRQRGEENVG